MASAAQDEFNELMRNKERRTAHPEDADSDARSFLNLSDPVRRKHRPQRRDLRRTALPRLAAQPPYELAELDWRTAACG
jgi:hypothetical protein